MGWQQWGGGRVSESFPTGERGSGENSEAIDTNILVELEDAGDGVAHVLVGKRIARLRVVEEVEDDGYGLFGAVRVLRKRAQHVDALGRADSHSRLLPSPTQAQQSPRDTAQLDACTRLLAGQSGRNGAA